MKKYAEYLESTLEKDYPELLQSITTKFNTPSVSMAEAISEHFGQTRIAVLRNVIEEGIRQLYLSFDSETRGELAGVADSKTTKYMLSKGAKITSTSAIGHFEDEWTEWRMQNFTVRLHERADEILEEDSSLDGMSAIKKASDELKVEFPFKDDKC